MPFSDIEDLARTGTALRLDLDLLPSGGGMEKVFPPTYSVNNRAAYAMEPRWIDGQALETILLDSVASQANRMEQALLAAADTGRLGLPHLEVWIPGHGRLTDLDVPHRLYDAVFLDSELDGVPFAQSNLGQALSHATPGDATVVWKTAPAGLIYGAWNSHAGQRIGLVSEIIGGPVMRGAKTASRLDPLGIIENHASSMSESTGQIGGVTGYRYGHVFAAVPLQPCVSP